MDDLTLQQLVALGMDELVAMAGRGELRPEHVWVAVRGAKRYHAAVRDGDIAPPRAMAARATACSGCHHRSWREVEVGGGRAVASYCGAPFVDQGRGRPCGCLVMLTVAGQQSGLAEDRAAGKAVVGSEACPIGEW